MRWTTVVTALAFLAIPTIAGAHAGNPDPNMVHVCIGNVSKVVRSVGVGGVCISGPPILAETADHWPKQATAGPKGDKGDQGIQGIQGVQGNPGTNGTNGQDGAPGTPGTNGIDGINGTNGIDGTNGTRADPPRIHNTNRYVNCGNGTVTDTATGLIWLQQADCLGANDWAAANVAAAALANGQCNLTDGSSAGDWRLPTRDEWSATIARAVALPCTVTQFGGGPPSLTNDSGTACLSVGPSSFAGVASFVDYWSSTPYEIGPTSAWYIFLGSGAVSISDKDFNLFWVWPVRSGPR